MKTRVYFKVLALILPVLLFGQRCVQKDSFPAKINHSLFIAGENDDQILEALSYYKTVAPDSHKLKAMYFLIENMQDHYSNYKVNLIPEIVSKSHEELHLSAEEILVNPNTTLDISTLNDFRNKKQSIKHRLRGIRNSAIGGNWIDLKTIKSDWLISHVENSFDVWNMSPFAQTLTFSEFCETLLPYRVREESLEVPASFFREQMQTILFQNHQDIESIVNNLNSYTTYMNCIGEQEIQHLGELGYYNLIQFEKYECGRHSEWTVHALNSCGIPATLDFTAQWLNRDRHHYWVSIRDTSGIYFPFTPIWQPLHDKTYFDETSKVYRRTFSKQISPATIRKAGEQIPNIFATPFIKDVTDEYHQVVDVSIKPTKILPDCNLAYLAVFAASGWKPVAWGTVDQQEGTVNFKKIPVNVVYIFGFFPEGKFLEDGQPFFLNENGLMSEISPQATQTCDLRLVRKFKEKEHLVDMMLDMVGSTIEGANLPDFSDADVLHVLSAEDLSDMVVKSIKIKPNKPYKFLRCRPINGHSLNIATFEIYGSDSIKRKAANSIQRILARPISKSIAYDSAFDSNILTYITRPSLEVTFDSPVVLSEVRFAPRNSNNAVTIGDRYELFYYDKAWISLGEKKAEGNFLIYNNAPSDAMYWLRDLDTGHEEQAFLYKMNRQYFINDDKDVYQMFNHHTK